MRIGALVAGAILAIPAVAIAGDEDWSLKGEGQVRVQNDFTYRAKNKKDELNNTFTKTEVEVELTFREEFSLVTQFKLEPVKTPDGDSFFRDHGLWMEQLYLKWDPAAESAIGREAPMIPFEIFAGKFNPRFSFGYDKAPFIYGRDFVEDYETTGAIGFGGALKHKSEDYGEHALTGTVYFLDSTPLSETLGTRARFDDPRTERPKRLKKSQGGVGNTKSLESFTISLDGGQPAFAPGLEYTLGYRQQKRGVTEEFNEKGFVVGLAYEIELAEGLKLTPMAEYAYFDKFEGADLTARYITGSMQLDWGPWMVATSYTDRRLKQSGVDAFTDNDRLFQVTAGYTFDFGLGLYVGWKTQRVAGETSDSLGVMALYKFEF